MHAIAYGKRLLGKVDKVPGKYHVATLCWHFCYLPLAPLGTYLVVTESMSGMTTDFQGVRIPFSLKSWLVAWSRTLLAGPFVFLCILAASQLASPDKTGKPMPPQGRVVILGIAVGVSALLFVPYWVPGIGRATRARAARLAVLAAGHRVTQTVEAENM